METEHLELWKRSEDHHDGSIEEPPTLTRLDQVQRFGEDFHLGRVNSGRNRAAPKPAWIRNAAQALSAMSQRAANSWHRKPPNLVSDHAMMNRPWMAPDLLPAKPPGSDYGYQAGKKSHPCTRDELLKACGPAAKTEVELVWYPEVERLVPVSEVPFLWEAACRRQRKQMDQWLVCSILSFVCFMMSGVSGSAGWRDFLWINFFFLGLLPVYEWAYGTWQLRSRESQADPARTEASRFGLWVGQHRIVYMWVVLLVSAVVTLVSFICGLESAIQKAGLVKSSETRFQLWRLISGPLMHGSAPHVLFNLASLASLGTAVEVMAGRGAMAFVVLVASVTGSIFSCWFLPDKPSVGLSGGVMGLLGFIFVLGLRLRSVVPSVLPKELLRGLLTTVFVGLVAWKVIDNAAHLGGGLMGAALGWWMTRSPVHALPLPRNGWLEVAGGSAIILIVSAGGWAVFLLVR